MLDSRVPPGELANKWLDYKSKVPLVSPSNKHNIDIIVIPSFRIPCKCTLGFVNGNEPEKSACLTICQSNYAGPVLCGRLELYFGHEDSRSASSILI